MREDAVCGQFFCRGAGIILVLAFLLVGCDAVLTPPPSPTPTPTLTPTARTTATIVPGGFLTPIPPTPTFTPSPSPTPVIHIIEQGDTLFGIALEYGVTLDGLLQTNGLVADQILRIGQSLIIPIGEEESGEAGMAAPVGNLILPTPTPLPLDTTGVALYQTPVGGMWCMGEVVNTTAGPVTNLQIRAILVAEDGTPLVSAVALAAADYLAPDGHAPFAVLFEEPPAGVADVVVSILRGEAVSAITAGFVPLDVAQTEGAVSGPQYRVAGQLVNNSGVTLRRITVVVTLYDDEKRVAGYRQQVFGEDVVVPAGQRLNFESLLTPQGLDAPADFQVLAWGVN